MIKIYREDIPQEFQPSCKGVFTTAIVTDVWTGKKILVQETDGKKVNILAEIIEEK